MNHPTEEVRELVAGATPGERTVENHDENHGYHADTWWVFVTIFGQNWGYISIESTEGDARLIAAGLTLAEDLLEAREELARLRQEAAGPAGEISGLISAAYAWESDEGCDEEGDPKTYTALVKAIEKARAAGVKPKEP